MKETKLNFCDVGKLEGKRTYLIPAELKHKRMVYDIGANSNISKWIFCEPDKENISYDQYDKDYVDYYFTGEKLDHGRGYMICGQDDSIIGFISYSVYDFDEQIYEMDLWLCCESVCGKGYGTDALKTLSDYLLSIESVRNLIIVPNDNNIRAVKSYMKAGYTEITGALEESLREIYPNGKPMEIQN